MIAWEACHILRLRHAFIAGLFALPAVVMST
jgi:hypothetical protein